MGNCMIPIDPLIDADNYTEVIGNIHDGVFKMKWNVFYYNINAHKIEIFNIFDHWKFREDLQSDLKKCRTKEAFAERLKSELSYYFWAKSEYELLFSPWVGGNREKDTIKVDVYTQVMANFEILLNYIWENKDYV